MLSRFKAPFRPISAKSVNKLRNLTQIFGKKGRQLHPTLTGVGRPGRGGNPALSVMHGNPMKSPSDHQF